MRAEDFMSIISEKTGGENALKTLREQIPLGIDAYGEIVCAQTREHFYTAQHTCVTGGRRTECIRRILLTLSCLYERSEVNFLILSPRAEYGELLKLQGADITVPFVRTKTDFENGILCVKELLALYKQGKGYPKLILVLDGLEELDKSNDTLRGDLEEYRNVFDLLAREQNVQVISGVDLIKSIFSGNPGVFVGVGNCLVTTREEGKADVTKVGEDCSLSLPTAIEYPQIPSVTETVILLNSIMAKQEKNEQE